MEMDLTLKSKLINTELLDADMRLLRAASSQKPTPQQLRRLAHEFESIFINLLLREMRRTIPKGGLLDSGFIGELYTSMADRELSRLLARRGIGLGEMIYRNMIGRIRGGKSYEGKA
ncbi:rod-binding protein [Candidatus Poribacteria bacterium]|nr:rod-binding protein [Candidatus Poribacteria bacterium]